MSLTFPFQTVISSAFVFFCLLLMDWVHFTFQAPVLYFSPQSLTFSCSSDLFRPHFEPTDVSSSLTYSSPASWKCKRNCALLSWRSPLSPHLPWGMNSPFLCISSSSDKVTKQFPEPQSHMQIKFKQAITCLSHPVSVCFKSIVAGSSPFWCPIEHSIRAVLLRQPLKPRWCKNNNAGYHQPPG